MNEAWGGAMSEVPVLLVDDRLFVRMGLRSMIDEDPAVTIVGETGDLDGALTLSRELRPAVVVLGRFIHKVTLAEATAALLRSVSPAPAILVLTNPTDEEAAQALRAGATGLLTEQSSQTALLSAIRMAAAGYLLLVQAPALNGEPALDGGHPLPPTPNRLDLLTQREFDVFELITRGQNNAEIAAALSLSLNTVKSHVRSLLVKLGLRNRVQAVIYAYQIGFMRNCAASAGADSLALGAPPAVAERLADQPDASPPDSPPGPAGGDGHAPPDAHATRQNSPWVA
jgi:DNA-binding NarL/FixJ family response regulator